MGFVEAERAPELKEFFTKSERNEVLLGLVSSVTDNNVHCIDIFVTSDDLIGTVDNLRINVRPTKNQVSRFRICSQALGESLTEQLLKREKAGEEITHFDVDLLVQEVIDLGEKISTLSIGYFPEVKHV